MVWKRQIKDALAIKVFLWSLCLTGKQKYKKDFNYPNLHSKNQAFMQFYQILGQTLYYCLYQILIEHNIFLPTVLVLKNLKRL